MIARHHIYSLITMAGVCLPLLSCSNHDYVEPVTNTSGTMAISIAVQGATRSDSQTGSFVPGEELENTINLSNGYRILFFTAGDNSNGGGTYISMFNSPFSSDKITADEDGSYYYDFVGELPAGLPAKFKLLVLANWPVYPSEGSVSAGELQLVKGMTTIKDVVTHESARFSHMSGSPAWLNDRNLIPFYGVREYDINEINPYAISEGIIKENAVIDLNSKAYALPLLRAVAKIEIVNTNPDVRAFQEVYIDKVNDSGFCAPFSSSDTWNFNQSDYYHEYTWATDFTRELHLVDGANDVSPRGPIQFSKVEDDASALQEKWVAYVPEYMNVGVDDFCSVIISDGSASKKIYFATNGSEEVNNECKDVSANALNGGRGRYNIERNNVYRFTVTNQMTLPTEVSVSLDVQPFSEKKLSYDIGLMRDEQGDLKIIRGSNFWEALLAVFNSSASWIPRSGSYDSGSFVVGNYVDGTFNEFTGDDITGVDILDYREDLDDYYAIVLPSNGNVRESEIWLKDSDGCRVLSNFFANRIDDNDEIVNDQGCTARLVRDFTTDIPTTYYKDPDGYQRLQHNRDHSSIVLTHEKQMFFKVVEPDTSTETEWDFKTSFLYPVESWNEYNTTTRVGGDFWYRINIAQDEDNPGSPDNPDGNVKIVYRYGNLGGVSPLNSDGQPMTEAEVEALDKVVTVRFSDLSDLDKADLAHAPVL